MKNKQENRIETSGVKNEPSEFKESAWVTAALYLGFFIFVFGGLASWVSIIDAAKAQGETTALQRMGIVITILANNGIWFIASSAFYFSSHFIRLLEKNTFHSEKNSKLLKSIDETMKGQSGQR